MLFMREKNLKFSPFFLINNLATLLGGPVGFLAGVKIGGLAAVGGSILGYTGASVVR